METTMKTSTPIPKWLQWFLDLRWYEWLGWIVEFGLFATFVVVTHTQFAEDEPRAGWIMILLTILLAGPGLWLLLGYKPKAGTKFNKFDIGAIICFAIWAILLFYLILPLPKFVPGPFGSPV